MKIGKAVIEWGVLLGVTALVWNATKAVPHPADPMGWVRSLTLLPVLAVGHLTTMRFLTRWLTKKLAWFMLVRALRRSAKEASA